MNRLITYPLFLFAFILMISCSSRKDSANDEVNNDEWPAMDEFHMIMAESFHPFKDSANLEPAKANAAEMASIAEKWTHASLPEKVNNDQVKEILEQLKNDAASFAQTVQDGDTTNLGESLTALHNVFHKVQEAWYKPDTKEKETHEEH